MGWDWGVVLLMHLILSLVGYTFVLEMLIGN
jgi:hypothetical protein